MLSLFKSFRASVSLCQTAACSIHVTEKSFHNITEEKLKDLSHIRHVLKQNVIKRTHKSQRGLFHKKQPRNGNLISETDSTTKRSWKPNTHKKTFYSELLKRKFEIEVSTHAYRNMRLYGGFDNYILLTKPENLDSVYGEYIRSLMMKKVQNPDFDVGYVVKALPITYKMDKRKVFFNGRPEIWYPKDLRHTDLTQERVKIPEQMSKKELAEFTEAVEISKNVEDAAASPLVNRVRAEAEEELRILEPDRQLAVAQWEKQRKKKYRLKVEEVSKQAREDGYIADKIADQSKKNKKLGKKK